jgi:ribosomal protein S18 acetylase RimI-like enzyme
MKTKLFGDKKIIIRQARSGDVVNVKKFRSFINFLVVEDVKILMNEKATLREEKEYVVSMLKGIKSKTRVYLIAEYNNKIIGTTSIELERWRRNHIGRFSIAINNGYRRMGLGKHMMEEIIKLAKKDLNPKPKIIQLEVYANNEPAIGLYKKMGFKIVAKLPEQIQHKGKLIDELIMLKYM